MQPLAYNSVACYDDCRKVEKIINKHKTTMTDRLTAAQKKEVKNTMQKIASSGGKATLKKHGKDHFSKIAKKRWAKERAKSKKK